MAGSLGCRGMQNVSPRPQYILNRGEPGSQQSDPDAGMESSPLKVRGSSNLGK